MAHLSVYLLTLCTKIQNNIRSPEARSLQGLWMFDLKKKTPERIYTMNFLLRFYFFTRAQLEISWWNLAHLSVYLLTLCTKIQNNIRSPEARSLQCLWIFDLKKKTPERIYTMNFLLRFYFFTRAQLEISW